MVLITLISTSEVTLVLLYYWWLEHWIWTLLILLELEWNHWTMYQTLKNDNSQINRGSTFKINHFFLTLTCRRDPQPNYNNKFKSRPVYQLIAVQPVCLNCSIFLGYGMQQVAYVNSEANMSVVTNLCQIRSNSCGSMGPVQGLFVDILCQRVAHIEHVR